MRHEVRKLIRAISVRLSCGTRSFLFYVYLSFEGCWWMKQKKKPIKICIPRINSASHCSSYFSLPLYSHFYPQGAIFPRFGIITNFMLAWHKISNCSNYNGKKTALKFSILEFFLKIVIHKFSFSGGRLTSSNFAESNPQLISPTMTWRQNNIAWVSLRQSK